MNPYFYDFKVKFPTLRGFIESVVAPAKWVLSALRIEETPADMVVDNLPNK
jgi:hypothetical protein